MAGDPFLAFVMRGMRAQADVDRLLEQPGAEQRLSPELSKSEDGRAACTAESEQAAQSETTLAATLRAPETAHD